ncbi:TetR family transcriptional regulator [Nocardia terpenica]|uniref:TetR family transcriptional regulator n=2 Tax=Nocardia terpenica TaxID=455432 RepID=A0A6G9ZCB9_9NOCA|nr:TetR family transcriptional regulator [Nocardia terpenica]
MPVMTAVDRLLAGQPGQPRADARRNLERLVAAARTAVAEVGVEVTAQEIARRAGVGKGTFYRRISSREELLRAVLEEVLDEIVGAADAALAEPDAWQGFCEFATVYARLRAESCGLSDALGASPGPELEQTLGSIRDRIRTLAERAQAAGSMRTDITWQDVAFVLAGVTAADHTLGFIADDRQWDRNLRVALDGLRARTGSGS